MFIKLTVILIFIKCVWAQDTNLQWELAVVIENQIKLRQSNGSLIESKAQQFSSLKALAYDNVRDKFIVSDMDNINDTIYTVQISKETDVTVPIVQGLPGDVQGLAVDPIDDNLYWTDASNLTINYVSLKETVRESKQLFKFEDKKPHALAIDICKRYIYWTNSGDKPTIERAKLDGTEHEVLVDTLIMSPEGLTIDYKAQKLYWADSRVGTVGGRIESIDLDGKNRQTVVERNTMQPFGIAVDEEAIYWTDTNNMGLYKLLKSSGPRDAPEKLLTFSDKPMGLVTNNNIVKEEPDCIDLENAIKSYKEYKGKVPEKVFPTSEVEKEEVITECLNDGQLRSNNCACKRGFTGKYCETSICQNFCFSGDCYLSSMGKPMCHCDKGFVGDRCQKNKCDGYCLNGGECYTVSSRDMLRCNCPEEFIGDRCEYNIKICDIYCQDRGNDLFSESFELLCRCNEGLGQSLERNRTAALLTSSQKEQTFLAKLNDPIVYLSALVLFCMLVIISLTIYIRTIHKKRPRIKKRIIVNKNVTPLTYRPQPTTEQCEITIENCCNMNVCETPCFEPRGEDKKKLLTNMEGEDY